MFKEKLSDLENILNTDFKEGLKSEKASKLLEENGLNVLETSKKINPLAIFINQFKDFLIYVLFGAVIVTIIIGETVEAIAILVAIVLNAIIGFIQEFNAEKELSALKSLSKQHATVLRDGKRQVILAQELVVGDIVIIETGAIIPADIRLIESHNLNLNESTLTGESVPILKDKDYLPKKENEFTGDIKNMVFSSTFVTTGRGVGVVVKTGRDTKIGKIADLLVNEKEETTPLEKRILKLGKTIGLVSLLISVLLFVVGFINRMEIAELFLVVITFAVKIVPESLSIIITIILALGVKRMAKRHAIIRKLSAVETLGSVNIVCTDKTGTLTQNKMEVTEVYYASRNEKQDIKGIKKNIMLEGLTLCEDANIAKNEETIGDPTEIALVELGLKSGIIKDEIDEEYKRIDEIQFDSNRKMMTTVHHLNNNKSEGKISFTKGAIDVVLKKCNYYLDFDLKNGEEICIKDVGKSLKKKELNNRKKSEIIDIANKMSKDALRVIAIAMKTSGDFTKEENLIFLGMVGMIDPPRKEAKETVDDFKAAGIRTIMITGDHKLTAFAIAKELGIATNENEVIDGSELEMISDGELKKRIDHLNVFARVSPEHKHRIIKLIKEKGNICSMTGDGVNDAPSLKKADIGVSMGITGTDVAEEASDMVLVDDNFYTIRNAIEEGRKIFLNIKKTILFIFSSIFADSAFMLSTFLLGLPFALNPLQILWTNMVADILPYLSLGVDHIDTNVMREKPRSNKASFFSNGAYKTMVLYAFLMFILSFAVYLYLPFNAFLSGEIDLSPAAFTDFYNTINSDLVTNHVKARTLVFVFICIVHAITAICFKDENISIFKMKHGENKLMLISIFVALVLSIMVCTVPFLMELFSTTTLSLLEWAVLILIALIPVFIHEMIVLAKFIKSKLRSY